MSVTFFLIAILNKCYPNTATVLMDVDKEVRISEAKIIVINFSDGAGI